MIAELTPIKETRVGQELFEEGIKLGRWEEAADLVRTMGSKGKTGREIANLTDLPLEEIERILGFRGGVTATTVPRRTWYFV